MATQPCPCGYRGDARHECSCDDAQIRRYRSKLSGPLLDRIDLRVPVPAVPWEEIRGSPPPSESSKEVRARVIRARDLQRHRYRDAPFRVNAEIPSKALPTYCPVSEEAVLLLERAASRLHLSMRAYVRVLRVARSIADLAEASIISASHLAEALSFRGLE
jgi:magnesium chelatase family protein